MQFLQPIWLWLSAAMIIPLLIHLWHVREGRRLKIGSVVFLEASTKQRSSNRIPRDLILLLLRCLVIVTIAFLMAKPTLTDIRSERSAGWVLLERKAVQATLNQYKNSLDSCKKAGMELRYFEPGFPQADLTVDPAADSISGADYFSLAAMLEQESAADRYKIFVPFYASNFQGVDPGLPDAEWYPVTTADSVSEWIAGAWSMGQDSIRVIKGRSDGARIDYIRLDAGTNDPEFELINDSIIRLRKNKAAITVDRSPLVIEIVGDHGAPDSRYLQAALQAVSGYTGRNFSITLSEPGVFRGSAANWLFWLSETALPENRAENLFRYRPGKPLLHSGWLEDGTITANTVFLNQIIPDTTTAGKVWTDGSGQAVLSRASINGQVIYDFSSRFQPAWSGLPWSENFPAMMMRLMLNDDDGQRFVNDRRLIDPAVISAEKSIQKVSKELNVRDISTSVWIILLTCFLAERMLSWYYQKYRVHGG